MPDRPNQRQSFFFLILAVLAIFAPACKKLDVGSNCLNDKAPCFKADKTAPRVDASLPQPNTGSTTVSILTAVQVTFSEEMKDATDTSHYALSGTGQGSLAVVSVETISTKTVQVNLTGLVGNGPIVLSFPGLTDFNGNALVAANATVTLTGNLNIGVVFEDASTTYYVSNDNMPTPAAPNNTNRTSAVIKWHHVYDTDNNNSYQVKIGGSNCADAANATGTNVSGAGLVANSSITTTLSAASNFATAGSYIVRICLDNTNMNKSGEGVATVISDNTEPTIIASLGTGAYGGVKSVTFSCSDNCDTIAYNVLSGSSTPADPDAPTFNSSGSVLTGTLLSGAWITPHASDPWITKITLVAFDRAGNQSTPVTLTYTIDTNIPNITFGMPASTYNHVSGSGAAGTNASTTLTWQSDKTGSYLICRGDTGCTATPDCGSGTQLVAETPYSVSGTVINTNITATSLSTASGGVNTIHVCVKTASQLGDATYTLVRDDTVPAVATMSPANGATGILPATKITVNLDEAIGLNTATLTTNTFPDTTCSGTFQLSANNFSTCIPMAANPTLIGGQSYQLTPKAVLQPGQYKVRVTNGVRDLAGNSLATTAQSTGFLVIGLLRQFTFNSDDTNLIDQAQTSNNLTAVGSPQKVTGVDGDTNGAYRFTNAAQYLTGLDTGLPSGNAARTICVWAQSNNQCGPLCMATMYGSTANGPYVGFWNGRAVYGVYGADLLGNSNLPIQTWTHICSVYNGSVATVYVNGIQNGSTASAWNTILGGGLTVGRQSGGSSFELEGRVDDVRIYSGALSASDIRQMGIQVPNGLMAYFPFSDAAALTAIDYSGNGHTGTRVGAPAATADRSGVPSGAYNFVNSAQAITAPGGGLPSGNAPRSVCAWVRPTVLPTAGGFAIAAMYGSPMTSQGNYIGFYHNGATITAIYSAWGDHVTANYAAQTGVWTHLCGTYDGTTASLYVNGGLLTSTAKNWNTVPVTANGGIYIGQGDNSGSYPFNGAVDDVRIYNRVLAESEIIALSGQLGAGLLRQYTFTGGSLSDDAGSGLTLTAVGSPAPAAGFDGVANGAFTLTGTQQFTVTDAGLPAGNSPRTMCSWAYAADTTGGSFALSYGQPETTGQGSFIFAGSSNVMSFGSYSNLLQSTYNLPTLDWHHVCATLDATGSARLYVDGVIAPGGGPTPVVFSTVLSGNLAIGARSDNGFRWRGRLDSLRIYNRTLAPAEILELQNY